MREFSKDGHLNRKRVIEPLTAIRQEWEEAARREGLVAVEGSVRLMLNGFAVAAQQLTLPERVAALGFDLVADVAMVLESRVRPPAQGLTMALDGRMANVPEKERAAGGAAAQRIATRDA